MFHKSSADKSLDRRTGSGSVPYLFGNEQEHNCVSSIDPPFGLWLNEMLICLTRRISRAPRDTCRSFPGLSKHPLLRVISSRARFASYLRSIMKLKLDNLLNHRC